MKPIAITAGDPDGVGFELLKKILDKNPKLNAGIICPKGCAKKLGLSNIPRLKDWQKKAGCPFLFWLGKDIENLEKESERRALVIGSLKIATALALEKKASAIVTGPVSKKLLRIGKRQFPGQTEFIVKLCGSENFAMAFWVKNFLVALLTTHLPLKDVPARINRTLIENKVKIVHRAMQRMFKIQKPKIAMCGLNPHAGEGGILGKEESKTFEPAIENLKRTRINVYGPVSADTAFFRALSGEFDAVIACYHDQALAAIKTLDFFGTVHLTLGLPIIRTSPDHGPAYDLAGKGTASEKSFSNAIRLAQRLTKNF